MELTIKIFCGNIKQWNKLNGMTPLDQVKQAAEEIEYAKHLTETLKTLDIDKVLRYHTNLYDFVNALCCLANKNGIKYEIFWDMELSHINKVFKEWDKSYELLNKLLKE